MSADTPSTPSLASRHVAFKDRDSQNVKPWPYVKELLIIAAYATSAALVGNVVGRVLEKRNIKLFEFGGQDVLLDRKSASWIGGKIGGIYGIFKHWGKASEKREGVKEMGEHARMALDVEPMMKEAALNDQILHRLDELQEKRFAHIKPRAETHPIQPKSHHDIQPRGDYRDALLHSPHAAAGQSL